MPQLCDKDTVIPRSSTATYVPEKRCRHNHPPLRYKRSRKCVYCAARDNRGNPADRPPDGANIITSVDELIARENYAADLLHQTKSAE